MAGLLILSRFKSKVFSFDLFSLVGATIIFTESITKPKVLTPCAGAIWNFLKFMRKLAVQNVVLCMFYSHIDKVPYLVKKSSVYLFYSHVGKVSPLVKKSLM